MLRACYFQDNIDSALTPAMRNGIYPHFMVSADAPVPMVATKDVGRFAAAALLRPPPASHTVDVLGPAYSVRHVAERLGAALGTTLQIVDIPAPRHVAALTQAGVPQPLAEALAEMFAAVGKGLIRPQADRQLIGTTTIDEVIGDCLQRRCREGTSA